MVHVLESLSGVGGDLHSRDPGGKDGEVGVFRAPEAVSEVGASGVVVDEVEVVGRDRGADEACEADVVALADLEEEAVQLRNLDPAADLAVDDDGIGGGGERAAPGVGGDAGGAEVVGGGGDVGEGVNGGVLGEGAAGGGEGGGGGGGIRIGVLGRVSTGRLCDGIG